MENKDKSILFIKEHGAAKIHIKKDQVSIEGVSEAEAKDYTDTLLESYLKRGKVEPFSKLWHAVRFFEKISRALNEGGVHV